MASSMSIATIELMERHCNVLRDYAKTALVHREPLTVQEELDRKWRAREFMAIGAAFKLTERETVTLVYRGLFDTERRCGCPACRARNQ